MEEKENLMIIGKLWRKRKMEIREIIKLYELGFMDQQGNICEDIVSEIGYEDGHLLGSWYGEFIPCGCEVLLLDMEWKLKKDYYLKGNGEFQETLSKMFSIMQFALSEDVKALCACDKAMEYYFEKFIRGYEDTVLDRLVCHRVCKRKKR